MWDLSCVDWEDRLREGRSLVPELPLIRSEADMGLAFFDELRLPDVPGKPRLGDAAGQWFRDIVAASFGSWDPVKQINYIRDIFCEAPKGSSKTSYGAGAALSVMLMNKRPRAEALFVGPTQAISDRAYEQAVGMIDESPELKRRFRPRDHIKTIEDLVNRSEMKVKTFDLNILTGSILIFCHLDEIHLLGRIPYAAKVIRQIRGGLDKTPEGKLLITTTQSDDIPAGAHRDELINARKWRDGYFRGKEVRPTLSVLFELPNEIARDPAKWQDPTYWPMVQPNLGRSVHLSTLIPDWNSEKEKGLQAQRVWASQYLNIEMGVGMKTDGWPGAEYWPGSEDATLTIDTLIARSEAIVVGIDGGGLDDLYGLGALGREPAEIDVPVKVDGVDSVIKMKRWLACARAWCHIGVLERRQTIAARLQDFAKAGELGIVENTLTALAESVALIRKIRDAGKLACVAIDPEGPFGELVDALAEIDITEENGLVIGVPQGYKLMNAIKTTEGRLSNGMLVHGKSSLMDWSVGNVKIEPTATAIRATKQNAGDAKIDPWCAVMNAATVMIRNPEALGVSVFESLGNEATGERKQALSRDEEEAILREGPRHPRWEEAKRQAESRFSQFDDDEVYA